MTNVELFEYIIRGKETYADMIEFCCDSMVLNNEIVENLCEKRILL